MHQLRLYAIGVQSKRQDLQETCVQDSVHQSCEELPGTVQVRALQLIPFLWG